MISFGSKKTCRLIFFFSARNVGLEPTATARKQETATTWTGGEGLMMRTTDFFYTRAGEKTGTDMVVVVGADAEDVP